VTEPRIELVDVWEGYRALVSRFGVPKRGPFRWALQGVSMRVPAGQMVGVVGPNGAGKTTLLQCIAGVLVPTRGTIRTTGRTASLVDITAGVHRDLTGREYLMVTAVVLGMSRKEARASIDEIVELTGLPAAAIDEPLRTYSAGMGLRLAFALTVFLRPDVLVVDEVMAVGDADFGITSFARLKELRDHGSGIVLVSHDPSLVAEHCDRALLLVDGRIEADGVPRDVLAQYRQAVEAPQAAHERGLFTMRRHR
jgi:ABC-type polysaccharide/polyol phosphate transport system ATPase subunit